MIRIRGVRKSFESQLVLDGVDLDIPERSVVSIIGPSGSGKSTLLRTIDFLETANAGTIDFGEGPVSLTSTKPKDIASVRAKIGFVFQNYNLFLNRTVLDNVAIGLIHAKGKGRKEAVRIAYDELDRVGMASSRTDIRANCPVVSSNAWPLRARSPWIQNCWCWMSRHRLSIRKWWTACSPLSNPWRIPERPC